MQSHFTCFNKHTSFLCYRINYGHNKFYDTGPREKCIFFITGCQIVCTFQFWPIFLPDYSDGAWNWKWSEPFFGHFWSLFKIINDVFNFLAKTVHPRHLLENVMFNFFVFIFIVPVGQILKLVESIRATLRSFSQPAKTARGYQWGFYCLVRWS